MFLCFSPQRKRGYLGLQRYVYNAKVKDCKEVFGFFIFLRVKTPSCEFYKKSPHLHFVSGSIFSKILALLAYVQPFAAVVNTPLFFFSRGKNYCAMVCKTFNGKCEKYHFWVLCKGNNAGKPLQKPCPNCFIVVCDTQAERDFYESLCFSLWKAKIFERELIGSVIPFIRLPEFRQVINHYARLTNNDPDRVLKLADSVNKAIQYEEVIRQQLAKIKQLQMAIVYDFLKSCNP